MSARRGMAAAAAVMLLALLAACTGLPQSGPVNAGLPAGQVEGPDFVYRPDAPQPGATREQIVDGFIRAASGTTNNWDIARLYLAPAFRDQWKPGAGVTVDVLADRAAQAVGEDAVSVSVTRSGTVDENGSYAVADGSTTLTYTLAQQDDGQWRITDAPNGILLDQDLFARVYNAYSLRYFDPTWQYLVPDVRWFPTTNPATWITRALVEGRPSPWLADSVVSAFTNAVTLVQPSVPVSGGTARVDLTSSALTLDATTLARMQAQLQASLAELNVTSVQLSAAGTPVDTDAVDTRSTRVNPLALALTSAGFGFLSGADLQPIDGLSEAITRMSPAPEAITLSPDRQYAAVRAGADGGVWRAGVDRTVVAVDTRPGLVDPSLDPQGFIWSVPSGSPSQLIARAAGGAAITVQDAWEGAAAVSAMAVSRDGTRIVAAVTAGGRSALWVAGIVRDAAGAPERLGEPLLVADLDAPGFGVSWLDDATVGVLERQGDDTALLQQPIGGPGIRYSTPDATTALAGAIVPSGLRLRDATGAVFVRRGSSWQSTATGVIVLATQTGNPPTGG